jgi:aminoglycoside phosphotransferase (APT) family kinase protein
VTSSPDASAAGSAAQGSAAQWSAEQVVTPELAARLIAGQFPAVAASRVELLATGWDNTAFLVDARWLFRFPRREVALPGIRREIALLPWLAGRLPLAVPAPEFIGEQSEAFGWPFWGARLIEGKELPEAGLPDERRGGVARSVGEFLGALHDPALAAAAIERAGGDLPTDPMRRGSPARRAQLARPVLDRLASDAGLHVDPEIDRLLDRAASAPDPAPAELVLTHGDLHPRHVLVDDAGAAAGVIDWGDVCLADPAVDLFIAYSGFAGAQRAELLAAYGRRIGADRELAARTCALSVTLALVDYAIDEDRPVLLAECMAGLRRIVSG